MTRKTLKKSPSNAAPLRIVLYTFPLWGVFLLLMFMMPITGIIGFIVIAISLLILPFKARKGECPSCTRPKLFPFSGFGSACKGCGYELVLRDNEIHLLEAKQVRGAAGSGRGNGQTFKS